MALLFLLAMLTVCAAVPQDMTGKMFTFPQESDTDHVRLTTSRQDLSAVTVCLRAFTDLRRGYALFSLATPSKTNDFLIYKNSQNDEISINVRNSPDLIFYGLDFKPNTWHSICSTWDWASGLVQVWLDGKPSSRKFVNSASNIDGPMVIVLGQDQDSYGGSFKTEQSFVGMMSDVHMWDFVLSSCQIQQYNLNKIFPVGNVINWAELFFEPQGKVLREDSQACI